MPDNELFDAIYFSGSISLMPNPTEALKCTAKMLKPNGRIYITQTFQKRNLPLFGRIKPALKYITTIDFGKLTFKPEVDEFCRASGLAVIEDEVIENSVNNFMQAAYIIVLQR